MDFQCFSPHDHLNIYLLPIEKFKKITLRLFIPAPLDEDISARALLPYVLKRGSQSYPTFEALQMELEKLYGAILSANVIKAGELQLMVFAATFPNEIYLPGKPPLGQKVLQILADLLYKPLIKAGKFVDQYVETEKEHMADFIKGMINDKASLGHYKHLQHMCPREAFRKYQYGTLKDVEKLNSENLYEFYQSFLPRSRFSLYGVGNFQVETWKQWIEEAFPPSANPPLELPSPVVLEAPGTPQEITENLPLLKQSHLYMGFRSPIHYEAGDLEGLVVANALLGLFPHSKLFLKVREEGGMAYSVYSTIEKSKGLLFVYAGIDAKNKGTVQSLIVEQLAEIQKGNISDFELKSTLTGLYNSIQSIQDSPSQWISFGLRKELFGRDETLEEAKEALLKVDRESIVPAARTLKLDTVYFLTPQE